MKVIPHRDVWDAGLLGLYAFVYGLGLSIFQIAVFGTLSSAWVSIWVTILILAVMTFLVIPAISLWTSRFQIINRKRLMGACICASLGVALPLHVLAFINPYGAFPIVFLYTALTNVVVAAAWCGMAAILWPVVLKLGPIHVQDGSKCPQCGYCVRGVESQICPECGRAFSEIDLGLTTPAFNNLISGEAHASAGELTR